MTGPAVTEPARPTGPWGEPEEPQPVDDTLAAMGISYRQLDYWTRLGHLRPDAARPGSGNARYWPETEIEIARRMGRLAAAGLPLGFAAQMARETWPAADLAPGITVTVTDPEASS